MPSYLYRGVSESFHREHSGLLVPKTLDDWGINACCGDEFAQCGSGVQTGESAANSVVKHQWMQKGLPTSGISTTPIFKRALLYATREGTLDGYIYVIDRDLLQKHSVLEYDVADIVPSPAIPEDKEVILVSNDFQELPGEIIIGVKNVVATDYENSLALS